VEHVARGILHGIHDVFPPREDDTTDPISHKKFYAKARGPSKQLNASSASNSTALTKKYGLKRKNGRQSCNYSINGSEALSK
jgi:hypothetical protein